MSTRRDDSLFARYHRTRVRASGLPRPRLPLCAGQPFYAAMLFLLVAGCNGGEIAGGVAPKGEPLAVEVAKVRVQPMSATLELVGTLEAEESVVLRSEIPGVVRQILFEEGERVSAGALLVKLDEAEQRAQLREAEAQRSFARLDFERKRELAAEGAISTAELDRARASLRQLEAEIDALRARLAKTDIRAPFDGILGARQVSPGDRVEPDDPLVDLHAIGRLKVVFTVPEPVAGWARPGQKITVRVSAFPDRTFPGKVYFVAPALNPESRRLLVKGYVPNSEGRLKPGMFAEVSLKVRESATALAVPEAAVLTEAGTSFVYRVKDGKAERVRVTLGAQANGFVEVKGKLEEGDLVVYAGVQKLAPGVAVEPRVGPGSGGTSGSG